MNYQDRIREILEVELPAIKKEKEQNSPFFSGDSDLEPLSGESFDDHIIRVLSAKGITPQQLSDKARELNRKESILLEEYFTLRG